MKTISLICSAICLVMLAPSVGGTHCQIPCGIYDDPAKLAEVMQHVDTIEKSMKEITALAAATDALSANQLSRWVANKEAHATMIQEAMLQYFLAQRVKPVAAGAEGYDAYLKKLADHHAVIVAAMKAKQNVDLQYAEALKGAVASLAKYYPPAD